MTTEYSIQKMVSDGTLSTIALGIQYLQRNDIYMRIAGEATPQSGASSGYTWSFINNTTLKILPVVPNGVEVVVYRRTDVDAMYNVYSQNAQFDEATIDENNQQLLYIAQEYLEQGLPGAGVDTLEYVRDDGSFTYYRMRRTDGSYSEEFHVPSASNSTKVLTRESLRRSYAEAGYNLVDGSFETGGTVTDAADVLLYEASGTVYVWLGALPKSVPAGSSPETTGGISPAGDWVDVGDASLRSQLSSQNSGVIVDDSNIKVSHPESYGITRSLHEKNADIISVKDFGAVGDGVADDTAAIQKAIDTGKTVYFPDGIYKTSATLNVTGSQSISMYGGSFGSIYADRGAVIRYTGASGPLLRVVGGAIGFKVLGLYFDTNNAVALDLGGAWYVKVHDCVFTDASIGVYLHYDAPDYFSGVTEVTSCYFGRCAVGVKTAKVDINVIHVTNCTFFAGTNGVELGDNVAASSTRNIVIRDNLFESNTGHDVAAYGGAQQLLVDGNYFEENTPSVLARVYVVSSITSPLNCAVTVTNNTFSKNTSGDLIFVDGVSGLEIKQNWSAFGGIGFIRAYNLVDYNIERCTTVSGGVPCGIVIDNVLMNYESVSSRKSIEIGDKFDMVDSSQVQVAASVRAAITFNGETGAAAYSRLCSVAKLSTGKYRITFTNEMPNGAYILNGLIVSSNNGSRLEIVITTQSYCEVQVVDHTGVLRDSPWVSVSIIL